MAFIGTFRLYLQSSESYQHRGYSKKYISRGSHTVDVSGIRRTCRVLASSRTMYRFSLFLSLCLADTPVVIAKSFSVTLWQTKQLTPTLYLSIPITHHSLQDSSDRPHRSTSCVSKELTVNSREVIWNYYFVTLEAVLIKYVICHYSTVDEHV